MAGGPPRLFVVTGICASGKSTVARMLAERLDRAALIEGDVLRRMVVAGRVDMTADPTPAALTQLQLRYRHAVLLARSFLTHGFSVVWEDVIMDDLSRVVDECAGWPVHVVALVPSPATVLARDRARAKRAYGAGGWAPEPLGREFRELTPRIGLWLDTSDQLPEETVDEILARREECAVR